MNVGTKLLQAAAGNAGEAVYVDDVFSTFLWTGDSSGSRSINNGIDLDGEGGLVWIKGRTAAYDHALYDTARGATKEMYSNKTDAQQTNSNSLTSFNSNGFSIGDDTLVNNNNEDYVAWSFRKAEKFLDIVTYTGDGTTSRDISHNLGSAPGAIIIKRTDNTSDWTFQHRYDGNYALYLNSNATRSDSGATFTFNSSTFKVVGPPSGLADAKCTNVSGATYIAYLFGHNEADYGENSDEAIIYCDSFTNDSSSVGVEVNVGFEPQWLLIKGASTGSGLGSWFLIDSMRNAILRPNNTTAETSNGFVEFTSRGFTPTTYYDGTLVYVAIRRPNKPASELAATDLFTLQAQSPGEGADTFISTGFNVDTVIYRARSTSPTSIGDRLRGQSGGGDFLTNSNDAEGTNAGAFFLDHSNGVTVDYAGGHFNISPAATDKNYIRYFLRRAKGFFDVVAYAGTGVANRSVTHNLGVTPDLLIIKKRNGAADWVVWSKDLTQSGGSGPETFYLNNTTAPSSAGMLYATPTASAFTTYQYGATNASGDTYIAYLFATVAGISKIGGYTGTGSDLNVDCGFSAGARFVLIRRTDSTGDWYLYDSARGIVAGNDPYVFLNATDAEVTNTDYIDPLSSGFTVTSSAPAGLNASSGTYIFLAIA